MPDSKSTPATSQVAANASGSAGEPRPKKLLDQVRDAIKRKHYSPRTEESYANWIKRFILFHGKRHPNEMGAAEVEAFLTHLAAEDHVAASTQNQAFSALLFLSHVLSARRSGGPQPVGLSPQPPARFAFVSPLRYNHPMSRTAPPPATTATGAPAQSRLWTVLFRPVTPEQRNQRNVLIDGIGVRSRRGWAAS